MNKERAEELLQKYREGRLQADEMALLESWYLTLGHGEKSTMSESELASHLDEVWKSIPHETESTPIHRFRPIWWGVAASLILVGSWFLWQSSSVLPPTGTLQADRAPGTNKATIHLSDGSAMNLEGITSGEETQIGQVTLVKIKEGEVVYRPSARTAESETRIFHTISTPKAGQYHITLADGTKAWLNAASSIRFPAVFDPEERRVEVVGEVFFEVSKQSKNNRNIPFKVQVGAQEIEVLGTQFNVNSYADEGVVRTTLLEGSVKVRVSSQEVLLRPGQQATFNPGNIPSKTGSKQGIAVESIDGETAVAWKEGYFKFDQASLPELMRQIARWYDMEVVYEGPIQSHEFVGQIERSSSLSKVLQILEMGDVHFKIEGQKIIVMNP